MFITQVAWGHRQPESNIYIHVSTQETVSHNSTLIKNLKKKKKKYIFLHISAHTQAFQRALRKFFLDQALI